MKTIKEWFDLMQEPERSQAFENTKADSDEWGMDNDKYLEIPMKSLNDALRGSFPFSETPQGYLYWDKITEKY